MGLSVSRSHNGSSQPVDYLRNLEEIADVRLEFDDAAKLWALAVYPNVHSSAGFEPILRFGLPDSELEGAIRETWLLVMNALTKKSDQELKDIATALNATVPKDYDPQRMAEHWIPTPVRDTWESPNLVNQWKVERGYLKHFCGPIVLKSYGISHQLFAPAGNFLPVHAISEQTGARDSSRRLERNDAIFRILFKSLFALLKWTLVIAAACGAVFGIGYLIVHYMAYIFAFALITSFIIQPFGSTPSD